MFPGIITGVILLVIITIALFVVYHIRKGPPLPSHLKPYFKNSKELEEFTKKHKEELAKKKSELTDPSNPEEASEFLMLNDYDIKDSVFEKAMNMVEANLKNNPGEYGQQLGEIFALSKVYQNPSKAYYYYFIGFSQDGYSVGFKDKNLDPPYYCGPIGDFRNEAIVSDLVTELGWDTIIKIDQKAREWLEQNCLEFHEFLNAD